jgi:hypothetical protein
MISDRPNRTLSSDVELALLLAEQVGVHAAARFLMKRGAGFAVTCRVLAEPTRRRMQPEQQSDDDPAVNHLDRQLGTVRRSQMNI